LPTPLQPSAQLARSSSPPHPAERPSPRPIRLKRAAASLLFARNVKRDLARLENRGDRWSFREGGWGLNSLVQPAFQNVRLPIIKVKSDMESSQTIRPPSVTTSTVVLMVLGREALQEPHRSLGAGPITASNAVALQFGALSGDHPEDGPPFDQVEL
jgi:hypothetical protein